MYFVTIKKLPLTLERPRKRNSLLSSSTDNLGGSIICSIACNILSLLAFYILLIH